MARGQINFDIPAIAECYELSEERHGRFGCKLENRQIIIDIIDDDTELVRPGVYQKRYGGYNNYGYSRKFPKYSYCQRIAYNPPSNPNTRAQQARRSKFRRAVCAWQALSDSEKQFWRDKSPKPNVSGYNYFISDYMNQPDIARGFPYVLPCGLGT